jgi:GNAT superfamily N-acetyltransferase
VERPGPAVEFLHARSHGVMDLIAHFWERLSQTPPLQRGDLHLVAAIDDRRNDVDINNSQLDVHAFTGAMLYVPKAHRADVLALDPSSAAAFAAYIQQQGPKALKSDNGEQNGAASLPSPAPGASPTKSLTLTDLSNASRGVRSGELAVDAPAPSAAAENGSGVGKVPIDFLTGHADGISWMTPLLLSVLHRKSPARQLVNVVMQLPAAVPCQSDANVRTAREADVPTLNRWRRQYKEERGILFDADLDAWVQTGRIFVYEHEKQVVAAAKFDLELPGLMEIGGVYTFPEFRKRGFGAKIVSDLACRIRQTHKAPTLQVDELNSQALRLYEGAGWTPMGKLARVWLTGK